MYFAVVSIPSEIKKLGNEAVKIYRQALSEGEEKIPYCSLLILGQEQVGKTSLFRQLVGKPHLKNMERTKGIDNKIVETFETKSVCTTGEKPWTVKGDGDKSNRFDDALAGEVMGRLPDRQSKWRQTVSKSDLLSQLQEFSFERSQPHSKQALSQQINTSESNSQPRLPVPGNSTPLEHSKFPSAVQQAQPSYVPEAATDAAVSIPPQSKPTPSAPLKQPKDIPVILTPKQSEKLNETVRCAQLYVRKEPEPCLNVKDFAGQVVYRPMHHCYINRQAIYVVVFKLPDMFEYIHGRSRLKDSPLDEICYWIRSIYAHTYSQSDNRKEQFQRVLLVGTYRDELPNVADNVKEIDKFIEDSIIQPNISKKKPYANYVYRHNKNGYRFIIPVENTIDSNSESYLQDSGTKAVQDAIKKMSKSLPQFKEKYPIKWLKFEEYLQEQCEARKSTPVIKIEEAKELAIKSGITDENQQKLALQFFNDTGKLNWLGKYLYVCLYD